MEGDFDNAFKKIQDVISIEDIHKLDPQNTIHGRIASNVMNIYCHEGYLKDYLSYIHQFDLYLDDVNDYIYFQLGEFSKISKDNHKKDFFQFEIDLVFGTLDIEELDEYIKEIHTKDCIELMQCNYIKAKLGLLPKKDIDKLVIKNPYTKGLKFLMYALLEEDTEKILELYELSINNLSHIKYYYVESMYLFSKFLKDTDNIDYKKWFKLGYNTAKLYDLKYLVHLFKCLNTNTNSEYIEETVEIYDDNSNSRLYYKIGNP